MELLNIVTLSSNPLFSSLFFLFSLLILLKLAKKKNLNLPPSPPKLPIIGNIHQLGKLPHRSLRDLSRNYGSLLLLHLGYNPTLLVSSADMVREIVKNHDIVFSDRPKTTAVDVLFYGCKDLAFAPHDEYWLCSNCLKALSAEFDVFLDQVIQEHSTLESHEETKQKDFVSIIMQLQKDGMLGMDLTRDNIKAILLDMFVGGTDTTTTTMDWMMAELLKHPNAMKKVQEEVRKVVGNKGKVDAEDISKMHYLKCVTKETFRLHPAAPLLVPRKTSASVKLKGYDIPSGTTIMINGWAIQRDPEWWEKPEEFIPERFENSSIDFKGEDFEFIPFGFGRRGCPGLPFAVASIEYVVANLLYWFDWKFPAGETADDLDMTELYGVSVNRKSPLRVIPISHQSV
ncbi:hypothetical protein GQ457_09G027980 [Hibiscus cannabinus]